MRMPLGVWKLLPFDNLNINEFGAMQMNIHCDAHKYSFGGGYQFIVEFACCVKG